MQGSNKPPFDEIVTQPSKPAPLALAIYDFPGETQSDLSFCAGEEIELIEKIDDQWMRGRARDQEGTFPSAFVEVVVPF